MKGGKGNSRLGLDQRGGGEEPVKYVADGGFDLAELEAEADDHAEHEEHDEYLEGAERAHGPAWAVKYQDDEDVYDGDGASRDEGHLDEDVEGDGGADDLCDVGGDDGAFGEEVQDVVEPGGEVGFAVFGEVHAGDGAEFDAEGLEEDGEDVGHEDDEEEFEAEGGAGCDVGCVVSWGG